MITVKQILENYDLVTDKASSEEMKLSFLAQAGLFEETKLPMIRRSLNKNLNEMTMAEKKTLVSLLESLMSHILVEEDHYSKLDIRKSPNYPTDKELPTVIILKRKAIRVFPDHQKVGLYYSQALDRYVSIPFSKDLSPQINEAKKDDDEEEENAKRRAEIAVATKYKKAYTSAGENEQARIQKELEQEVLRKSSYRAMAGEARARDVAKAAFNAPKAPLSVRLGAALGAGLRQAGENIAAKIRAKKTNTPPSNLSKNVRIRPMETPKTPATPPPAPAGPVPNLVSKGQKPAPNPNRPIKESFRNKLAVIREKNEYGKADMALDAASLIPGPIGSAASLASAGMSLSRGEYGNAALDVAGALPGVGYLAKGAKIGRVGSKLASTAEKTVAKEAPKLSSTSTLAKGSKFRQKPQSGKPNSKLGLGATLGALGASALKSGGSDDKPLFEPTQQNRPEFGGVIGTSRVTTPKSITGAESGLDASTLQRQRQIYSQMNESNNLNIIKSMIHENVNSQAITIGEETISINKSIAKKIVKLHESLNKTNKKKLEKMLNENILSFRKAINFALKQ